MSTIHINAAFNSPSKRTVEKMAQLNLKITFGDLVRKHFFPVFEQVRTARRVLDVLQAMLLMGPARRTVTNNLTFQQKDQDSWSSDYKAFSDGKWNPEDLFHGVFNAALPLFPATGPIVLGIDDTGLPHTGDQIENAGWIHNPLVPKWIHPAIQWGVPMLHASILIQSERVHRPTGITVAFEPLDREKTDKKRSPKSTRKGKRSFKNDLQHQSGEVKGNPKKVPPAHTSDNLPVCPKRRGRLRLEDAAHKKAEWMAKVVQNEGQKGDGPIAEVKLLATERTVRLIWRVRRWMDEAGLEKRPLIVVGDGSYTNKTVMLNLPPNTEYVGRTRPDTTLQAPGGTTKGGRIKYGVTLDKPKDMATEHMLKVNLSKFHYAGAYREMKYLAIGPVFRKTSTRDKLLRLMILEPVPYGKGESRGYNERAYLLTTDMSLPAEDLVAFYLMRWELENIHRIFKTTLGLGDAQVRKQRLPSAMAAYFSLLVVAIHLTQGDERHEGFGKLPKWTTNRRAYFESLQLKEGKPAPKYRASAEDILAMFRNAMADTSRPKNVKFMRLVA